MKATATASRARLSIRLVTPRGRAVPRLTLTSARPRERAEALLDHIVRGRAWIPVLGVLLIGIVAMQVEVLKLGASVGRSMNTAAVLTGQNQLLQAEVSGEDSPAVIERTATGAGLTQPGPDDDHFVSSHTSVEQAIRGIHAPNASEFASRLAAERALDDPTTSASQSTDATANSAAETAETPGGSAAAPGVAQSAAAANQGSSVAAADSAAASDPTTASTDEPADTADDAATADSGDTTADSAPADGTAADTTTADGPATTDDSPATGDAGTATGDAGTATGGDSLTAGDSATPAT